MGEVYRAQDTKLKRDGALKVLPEVFASDPERMARFQPERVYLWGRRAALVRECGSVKLSN